ncbi:hypothetical protein GORDON_22 [Arthrobacter phage Gordon]|uniref:Minor tail protein n=1 Tax=Arthrobacter phage Gordon TaxID=1772298 RepID=A0A0U4JAY5_9CAUD|nr:minor tail protein [Arthrobacter phage Gordon]ALY08997.1 hypothetical protein GORDON_22 [Arthrobacter phage Gordon]
MVNQPDDPNQAQAWISGTPPDQTIDFYIPRGNTGPRGPIGPIGPSLAVGSVETVTGPAAPGTVGPTGLTGPKGDPGGLVAAGQLTGSPDLNTIVTPGTYRNMDNLNATTALNFPNNGVAGHLLVIATGPQIITQIFWPINSAFGSRVQWVRSFNATWSPWRSFNSTRVDVTAGRAIYQWNDNTMNEQLIYSDTGWRTLTAEVLNGWTAVAILVRRVGAMVFLRLYQVNGTAQTANTIVTLPAGFRSGVFQYEPCYTESSQLSTILVESTGNIKAAGSNIKYGMAAYAEVKWSTTDVWPTTLPGTASGSIPT